jgi:hypothetical protein
VIRIVPGPEYTDADGQRVLDKLAAQVSARVVAQIELVDHIPASRNGKYKWVVQEHYRVESAGGAPNPPRGFTTMLAEATF